MKKILHLTFTVLTPFIIFYLCNGCSTTIETTTQIKDSVVVRYIDTYIPLKEQKTELPIYIYSPQKELFFSKDSSKSVVIERKNKKISAVFYQKKDSISVAIPQITKIEKTTIEKTIIEKKSFWDRLEDIIVYICIGFFLAAIIFFIIRFK